MSEWKAGIKETWFTLARRERHLSIGPTGGAAWTCQKCGYFPGPSEVPHNKCGNCGEQLQTTADDPHGQAVVVETTPYGYKLVSIGKTPNASLSGAA